MKMNALLIALPLLIGSCSDDNNSYNDPATVPTDIIQTVVKTTDNISIGISTDKAAYKPGETVRGRYSYCCRRCMSLSIGAALLAMHSFSSYVFVRMLIF
jgi:hypothetical protein